MSTKLSASNPFLRRATDALVEEISSSESDSASFEKAFAKSRAGALKPRLLISLLCALLVGILVSPQAGVSWGVVSAVTTLLTHFNFVRLAETTTGKPANFIPTIALITLNELVWAALPVVIALNLETDGAVFGLMIASIVFVSTLLEYSAARRYAQIVIVPVSLVIGFLLLSAISIITPTLVFICITAIGALLFYSYSFVGYVSRTQTSEKRAQLLLSKLDGASHRISLALGAGKSCILEINFDARTVDHAHAVATVFGEGFDPLTILDPITSPVHIDDRRACVKLLRSLRFPDASGRGEFKIIGENNEIRVVEVSGHSIAGQQRRCCVLITDITERVRERADLRQAKIEKEEAFDNHADLVAGVGTCVWGMDFKKREIFGGDRFETIFGFIPNYEQLVGIDTSYFDPEEVADFRTTIRKCAETGETMRKSRSLERQMAKFTRHVT